MNQDAPDPAEEELSAVLDRFEEAWQEGTVPNLETFLPTAVLAGSRQELLGELVKLDLEFRWRQKQSSRLDETLIQPGKQEQETLVYDSSAAANAWLLEKYVEEYPQLGSVDQLPLALIVEEYRVRQRWGDRPSHQDYLERFSQRNEDLSAALSSVDQELANEIKGTEPGQGQASTETVTVVVGQDGKSGPGSAVGVGSVVGDYELLAEIGRGGMGVVYRARQLSLQREVALKMILPGQLADQEAVERFYSEAQIVGQLRHPNIVMVYEVAEHDGNHYFSMDYIEGDSLAERIRRAPLSAQESASFVVEVTRAIQFAHEAGILHRDLKPSNILIDGQGKPLVTDFGLAKRTEEDAGITRTGSIVGTPSYMPPEQVAAGGQDSQGPASDVYSLGAILYELLTGRPPFRSDSMLETLMQVLEQEPVAPRLLAPGTDRDLETITLKCLEKNPQRRYGSAAELADEIDRYAKGEPILARPVSSLERAWRWCKRRPAIASLSAAVMVALVAGTLISSYFAVDAARESRAAIAARDAEEKLRQQAEIAKKNAEESARLAQEESRRARAAEKETRRYLYQADMLLAQKAWEDADIGRLRILLERHASDGELIGFEWHYLNRLIHRAERTFQDSTRYTTSLAFTPDGKQVVSGSSDDTVKILDFSTGQVLRTLKGHLSSVTSVAVSSDGKRIVSGSFDKTIRIWDIMSGKEVQTLKVDASISCVTISPDDKTVISGGGDNTVRIWDMATGRELKTLKIHSAAAVNSVACSPDGKRIVSASGDGLVKVWDAVSGLELQTLKGHVSQVTTVMVSPCGKWIVSASHDGVIRVWSVTSNRTLAVLTGHTRRVVFVAFSADGTRVVSSGYDRTVRIWDWTSGEEEVVFKGHESEIISGAVTPDGKRMVSSDNRGVSNVWDITESQQVRSLKARPDFWGANGIMVSQDGKRVAAGTSRRTIKIWDAVNGQELHTFKGHGSGVFSFDGKRFISGSADKTIKIWDAVSGQELKTLHGHGASVLAVAISADGKRIVSGSADRTIKIWDAVSGEELQTFHGHGSDVLSVDISSDGKFIVSGSRDRTIKVWNVENDRLLNTLQGHSDTVSFVSFTPDGRRIVSRGYDRTVRLWNFGDGKQLHQFQISSVANPVAISPDGKRLFCSDATSGIKVVDIEHFGELQTLKGHSKRPLAIAVTADGRELVTVSSELAIRRWDARPLVPAKSAQ